LYALREHIPELVENKFPSHQFSVAVRVTGNGKPNRSATNLFKITVVQHPLAPRVETVSLTGSGVTIHWTGIVGRTYLGGADFSGGNLFGAQLFAANLHDASLRGADLSGADLRRADLRFANLSGAFAVHSDFSGANMSSASLRFLDLRGAKFDTNTVVDAKTRLVWQIVNEGVAGPDVHGRTASRFEFGTRSVPNTLFRPGGRAPAGRCG
jgi:hypothetical protein